MRSGECSPGRRPVNRRRTYRFFFLCLFFRKRFLRLCVAILCLLRFFPHGMVHYRFSFSNSSMNRSTPSMSAGSSVNVLYFFRQVIAWSMLSSVAYVRPR